MGDNTSIKDFSEYLKKLTSVSDTYIMYHDSLLGPLTKDGRTRLRFSKEFAKWGKEIGKEIDTKAVYIADHDEPIKEKLDAKFRESKTDIYIDAGEVFI